ncbi:BZ3500_MvSof-1268-A1-R1_Chr6-3g08904 [Microbotryum saponariae]|uniref:BZ3500_MvSof-1268-A1-R1_Chr6-3g08904 protein n=1 Tax=Microbotryum saponariae TaxID=289078 RepID=A0A2X0KQL4_9BASI|nr:BZ3500_MvSof-1268-A1-R1_Chr6-3g08904 [Microbotryum saponariae]SDA07506.1 BZ3501_MvSof-1269-A2-R1_Chr6-2g08608 [Microbotryum saponariae]
MPAISASTSGLPQQSVKAVPGKIHPAPWRDHVQNPASGSHFPSRPSQHSYQSSAPTEPPPIPPRNVFPPPSPTGSAPPRPTLTLYPQAIPLDPKATLPSPPRGSDPFRQTVPPSPQLPAGLPDRGGAGAEIGLGRPGSMQPFRPADHEHSRNITPQLPGAFPKSAGIEATTLPPASAGINPKRLPNKPIEAPTQKIVSPTSNPGRENVTPTKTPSSAQRRSGISKAHTPTSTSSSKPRVQCSGTTTSNKRCTRMVESTSGDLSSPGPLHGLHLASYCHQHLKTSLSEPGCFVLSNTRGGEHWVEYADWILSDLDERTKVLLRSEMSNAVSGMDSEGYLYVHEFPPTSSTTSTTYLKIGRSVKPLSRLSQWKNQCPSRRPIVRDVLPRANSTSRPVGATMHFAERGAPNHHRWERLVLIEVAGRAKMMALCSDQGKKEGRTTGSSPCGDCGQRHIEMFEVGKGAYDLWVRDVLERWERWCRDVIG